jgi:hypothetical protein
MLAYRLTDVQRNGKPRGINLTNGLKANAFPNNHTDDTAPGTVAKASQLGI